MSKMTKNFHWRRAVAGLSALLCCLLLAGCGGQDAEMNPSDIFTETEELPNLTEGVDTDHMIAYEYLGSRFYQGEKVQIWGERQIAGCSIYLHKEDGSRELLAEHVSPFDMQVGWWIDDQKNCYYKYGNQLIKIDENGSKLFTVETEEGEYLQDFCQLTDGRLIMAISKGGLEYILWEVDPASGKHNELVRLPAGMYVVMIASNGDGLMVLDQKGLWDVNLADGSVSSLISFEGTSYALKDDNGSLKGYLVKEDLRMLEDGRAEILWSDGTSEFLRQAQVGEEKKILTMRFAFSDSMLDSWMKEQIVKFNKESNDYYITIEEMGDADFLDFRQRTDMELAAGKGADIVCCYAANDLYSLLEKGAFADLTPYIEASGMKEEDYFPAAFSGARDGDRIYGLNCMVYMTGFWVDEAVAGEASISSVEDLMDCLLAYEGEGVSSSAPWLLRSFLENSESLCGMVDFENGTCDFGGELFTKLLEVTDRYKWDQTKSSYTRVIGTISYRNFYAFPDRNHWEGLGKIPVGYLFDDAPHTKAHNDAMLAINGNSANKEGAWEFLSFLLSEEVQSSFAIDGSDFTDRIDWRNYPVDRKMFDKLCESHRGEINGGYDMIFNAGSDQDFKDMLITSLSPKREEELRAALEDAKSAPLRIEPVLQIILEEADHYFSGAKSVEEVRDLVQNRVQLYLNERK